MVCDNAADTGLLANVAQARLDTLLLQDTPGVGHHGASLSFSTTSAGSSGTLQDWLTLDSTGLATFSGRSTSSLDSLNHMQRQHECLGIRSKSGTKMTDSICIKTVGSRSCPAKRQPYCDLHTCKLKLLAPV